jgi:hypothetical protein
VWRKQFWTNILMAFTSARSSMELRNQFWNSVAYFTFVQEYVGVGPGTRPTTQMWERGRKAFSEIVGEIKPECVIVLGKELWYNLPSEGRTPGPLIENPVQSNTWQYKYSPEVSFLAYGVHHPSSGFSSRYWHPLISQAIRLA